MNDKAAETIRVGVKRRRKISHSRVLKSPNLISNTISFGISDSAILKKIQKVDVLLTNDFPLYHKATGMIGNKAINFNHVRQQVWSAKGWIQL